MGISMICITVRYLPFREPIVNLKVSRLLKRSLTPKLNQKTQNQKKMKTLILKNKWIKLRQKSIFIILLMIRKCHKLSNLTKIRRNYSKFMIMPIQFLRIIKGPKHFNKMIRAKICGKLDTFLQKP
jgi:hypothetical protein